MNYLFAIKLLHLEALEDLLPLLEGIQLILKKLNLHKGSNGRMIRSEGRRGIENSYIRGRGCTPDRTTFDFPPKWQTALLKALNFTNLLENVSDVLFKQNRSPRGISTWIIN